MNTPSEIYVNGILLPQLQKLRLSERQQITVAEDREREFVVETKSPTRPGRSRHEKLNKPTVGKESFVSICHVPIDVPLFCPLRTNNGPPSQLMEAIIAACQYRWRTELVGDITQILKQIESRDPDAPDQLLVLVYDELRKLAATKLVQEKPGQTLQPTALVHEAYLRLLDGKAQHFNSRGHFFAAAAESMRRILVEIARRKRRLKRGGGRARIDLDPLEIAAPERTNDLMALDEALTELAAVDSQAAELVKLRYFAGFTIPQAAEVLGISPRSADSVWAYARAWLMEKLKD
jgi:RNA polymerase sigma factor (TIGR02999 family)